MNHDLLKRGIAVCLLILVGVLSCLVGARHLSAPELYAGQIASLDEKAETVLTLTASSTLASVGISAIPGDTATPIANKLADFSEYFLLILCVLYSEKYLLTIIPAGACRYLIPLICALFAVGRVRRSPALDHLSFKLLLVTLGLCIVIPLSVGASDLIYDAYRQSIDATIASAEELSDETSALAEAEDQGVIQSILNRISETTDSLTEKATGILNRFVETLAVMIVTSCVIPLLVLLFFFWIINKITGVDLFALRRGRSPFAGRDREKEYVEV